MYRPDLDGIRAICILCVIAFHFNFAGASLGYLGVDVFFLLSGFLIIGGILKEIDWDSKTSLIEYNFKYFYFRRARRLFPAALVVYLSIFIYSYFFTNILKLSAIKDDLKWSILFLANQHFAAKNGDYFQAGFSASPLMHTWSLSIEEQFYLFFPIFFITIWKAEGWIFERRFQRISRSSRIITTLCILTILSFSYNCVIMKSNPSIGYFSTLGRIWEILLGGLVCILRSKRRTFLSTRSSVATILFFISIFIGLLFFAKLDSVLKQLVAVLLFSVYLVKSDDLKVIQKVLGGKRLSQIGKISYALYLWHWPIIVFMRDYSLPREFSIAISLLLMFLLSTLSWYFVEIPSRKVSVPKKWVKNLEKYGDRNDL